MTGSGYHVLKFLVLCLWCSDLVSNVGRYEHSHFIRSPSSGENELRKETVQGKGCGIDKCP